MDIYIESNGNRLTDCEALLKSSGYKPFDTLRDASTHTHLIANTSSHLYFYFSSSPQSLNITSCTQLEQALLLIDLNLNLTLEELQLVIS